MLNEVYTKNEVNEHEPLEAGFSTLKRRRLLLTSLKLQRSAPAIETEMIDRSIIPRSTSRGAPVLTGFTLVELLVVMAIIGVLSSIILASTNAQRQKARDTKRVQEIKQIQQALEVFITNQGSYPALLSNLVSSNFLPVVPIPPSGASGSCSASYCYLPSTTLATYHLGVNLENPGAEPQDDKDCNSLTNSNCNGVFGAGGFDGTPVGLYDVQP